MHRARRNEICLSPVYRNTIQYLQNRSLLHPLFHILSGHLAVESTIDAGIRFTVYNIPHFIFAILVFPLHGKFIVRVHLHRQLVSGINELDQNRESRKRLAFPSPVFLTDGIQIFSKQLPLMPSACHHTLSGRMCGQLPAFRQNVVLALLSIAFLQLRASPQKVLISRLQLYKRLYVKPKLRLRQVAALHGHQVLLTDMLAHRSLYKNQVRTADIRKLVYRIRRNPHYLIAPKALFPVLQRHLRHALHNGPVLRSLHMLMCINRFAGVYRQLSYDIIFLPHQNLIGAPFSVNDTTRIIKPFQNGIFIQNPLKRSGFTLLPHINRISRIDNNRIRKSVGYDCLIRTLIQDFRVLTAVLYLRVRLRKLQILSGLCQTLQILQFPHIAPCETAGYYHSTSGLLKHRLLNRYGRHPFKCLFGKKNPVFTVFPLLIGRRTAVINLRRAEL